MGERGLLGEFSVTSLEELLLLLLLLLLLVMVLLLFNDLSSSPVPEEILSTVQEVFTAG